MTGGSPGTGEATALALAEGGADVGEDDVAVTTIDPAEVRSEFASESGESFEERFEKGEASEPTEIADAVRFAAEQDPSMVSEMDLYRRDKLTFF
ncbi:hypothetical protein I7X12_05105 [Halosimplex litoreum]|uniref:Short chain dehydrogenase n=1 Tax=Halosimplex litoreum TaxID=1198301 RepID=A0A7T3G0A0_9EURY|nr:hypothetical protein I7X12_05105 [Halosimplex litoreum]